MVWRFGRNGVFGSESVQPKLIVVDPEAPQRTRQSLQQIAEILNSLLRSGVIKFTGAREFELQYQPADMQDHPIGTPENMELMNALDRLSARVKALGG